MLNKPNAYLLEYAKECDKPVLEVSNNCGMLDMTSLVKFVRENGDKREAELTVTG